MRILLLEDDEVLADVLLKSLTGQHYIVDAAYDGKTGWEYALSGSYDLILTDVDLPLLDGITLCQRLRRDGYSIPILLMTAKDAIAQRIRGLDAGADDYLNKPLDLGELQARLRALLRRGEVTTTAVLSIGSLSLDPSTTEVKYADKPIKLTPKEYNLLELFLRNPSRVFSRSEIIDHLWNFDDPPLEESVKAHIKGLRQKLKRSGAINWIENVYGLGYRLNPKVSISSDSGNKTGDEEESNTPGITPGITNSVEQEYQNSVDKMWEQYQELMFNRLTVLKTASKAFQNHKLTEELQKSAIHEAHKLAGVLGMFGRETGTLLAKEIEQLLSEKEVAEYYKLPDLVYELDQILALSVSEDRQNIESKASLLLIDTDEQLGKELQQLTYSKYWYQVKSISAGSKWLQKHSPDLVVLSINKASEWQKSLELISNLTARTPSIAVIVITANNTLGDRVTVAKAGGCGFLVKPINATELIEVVNQVLRRNHSLVVNILVVDDDPMFLSALRPLLEPWGIRMTGLENPLDFWDVLESVSPDLLILDVEMPNIGGIELCQTIRTDPYWQSLPVLFLTSHRDKETIEQVFVAGGDDYISKPVLGAELLTRITNRLERNRLLRTISTKDPQTGIDNYTQSIKDLDYLLNQSQKNKSPFCLVVLKIAELNKINIHYSHNIGHRVLQKWGQLIQSVFRSGEILGYWGNGEFILGIPNLNKEQTSDRLSEILAVLRQQVFTASDGSRFQVTCNYSIAEYPQEGKTIHSLYQFSINSE
ncbi:MAG: response regulator [Cyanobacteria bacterium P01_A01_bin.84]